jgi:phosphoribosyl-ATP pyrophosphohydrolase/phosphoribosyl-AMP cyclohydrolase
VSAINIENRDSPKEAGLIPANEQDPATQREQMHGSINREALAATLRTGLVTFYSRSKQRLWQKGETSGHTLKLVSVAPDCDSDALLVLVQPQGPTCHRGTTSCFDP